MKKLIILMACLTILLSGCNSQEALDVDKYKDYKCFDYHLACLNAYEQKAKTTVEFNDLEYTIWFRKAVDESDEHFICASVRQRHPLASTEIVITQNPENYIDVFEDWTIKSIELYCIDLRSSKPLWDEDEPARTPAKILNTTTDSAVSDELIDFITNKDCLEKYVLQEDYIREIPNENYVMYTRVQFNESDNIVWDSCVSSYVSVQTQAQDITIDKGRCPDGIAAPNSLAVSIEDYPNLQERISETIDNLIDMN